MIENQSFAAPFHPPNYYDTVKAREEAFGAIAVMMAQDHISHADLIKDLKTLRVYMGLEVGPVMVEFNPALHTKPAEPGGMPVADKRKAEVGDIHAELAAVVREVPDMQAAGGWTKHIGRWGSTKAYADFLDASLNLTDLGHKPEELKPIFERMYKAIAKELWWRTR